MVDGNTAVVTARLDDMEETNTPEAPRRRRWPWLLGGLAVVAAAVFAIGQLSGSAEDADPEVAPELRFAEVAIRDLEETTTLDGTLGRSEGEAITAAIGGTITSAPEPGTTVDIGEVLYEIDAEPVVLLQGVTPAYRDLTLSSDTIEVSSRLTGTLTSVVEEGAMVEQGDVLFEVNGQPVVALIGATPAYRSLLDLSDNMTGPDVEQLELALDALGFNDSNVTIDEEFTDFTEQMVEAWQEAAGAEVDGVVDLGEVVFIPAATQVVSVDVAVGDSVNDGRVVLTLAGIDPMTGVDVQQLEDSLVALGYSPGTADGQFTTETRDAVVEWQTDVGLALDGVVDLGEVVFRSGPVRVSTQATKPGAPVNPGGAVLTITASEIVVTAELSPQDQGLVGVGDAVTIELPDNSEIPGTVSAVASVVTINQGGENFFEVTIVLDDPAQAGDLDEAPVEVFFVTDSATGVVAVPVTALLALQEGGYAVEVDAGGGATRLVGVSPGFFADGFVEVTGDIQPGDRVVVP
ncbi:MAG: HlyD family efflux transporter periplasmic adaptor subunit [Acidimicrobiia bacterium]|nr:peptidoglycan-binding protein [Acidimicrobiia bacterium]NNF64113.1 HlyD family efflux transporter periplasmic adaptor subunit [Acidimicrobiia bacterium]